MGWGFAARRGQGAQVDRGVGRHVNGRNAGFAEAEAEVGEDVDGVLVGEVVGEVGGYAESKHDAAGDVYGGGDGVCGREGMDVGVKLLGGVVPGGAGNVGEGVE